MTVTVGEDYMSIHIDYVYRGCLIQVVVDFVYTGVLALTGINVEEVLSAASHLQVNMAIELCSKYLETAIEVDNCVDILNLAELYSLTNLNNCSRRFVLENFEVIGSPTEVTLI